MATQPQSEFAVHPEVHHLTRKPVELEIEPRSAMDLLTLALQNNAAIDVIERLATLQREQRDYQARVDFDEALNLCQEKLRQVSADASNSQTNSRYASYSKLDKVVRPIYTAAGFAISYGEKDCPTPGKTRFVAYVSRAGVTREYIKDLSPSTKGPKGNDVMTPIHADGSADSYAKRYLLKNIFNIAIGEDDNDGNGVAELPQARIDELSGRLLGARDMNDLVNRWTSAANEVMRTQDRTALALIRRAKDERKAQLTAQAKGGKQ